MTLCRHTEIVSPPLQVSCHFEWQLFYTAGDIAELRSSFLETPVALQGAL